MCDLDQEVLKNISASDEVIIISGYTSPDMLAILTSHDNSIKITLYYGMYIRNGISKFYITAFNNLETKYPNLKIFIPYGYHVHTKVYIFKKDVVIFNALIESANCSSSALMATPNSEMLLDVIVSSDISSLNNYANVISQFSIHFNNPVIIPNKSVKVLKIKKDTPKKAPTSWNSYSRNPFSVNLPLYTMENGKPKVQDETSLNWGFSSNHHSTTGNSIEAYIPIMAFAVDNHLH